MYAPGRVCLITAELSRGGEISSDGPLFGCSIQRCNMPQRSRRRLGAAASPFAKQLHRGNGVGTRLYRYRQAAQQYQSADQMLMKSLGHPDSNGAGANWMT